MRRALAFTLGLLTLVPLAGCKKKICGPYLAMNLPGVTKVDRCDVEPTSDHGIEGETTATSAELLSAIAASGFELGRDGESPFGVHKDRVFLRKDGATYSMSTDLKRRDSGASFFTITPEPHAVTAWVPEASYQLLVTERADRDALFERLSALRSLLEKSPDAPGKCDAALDSLDPALAKAPRSLLVNLDSAEFKGSKDPRGPLTLAYGTMDESGEHYQTVSRLLPWRAAIDSAAARRVVPVMVITDYVPVKKNDPPAGGGSVIEIISGGAAKLDVAVVDRKENKVLCRSKAEAKIGSKSPVPKNAPTLKRRDGTSVTFQAVSPEEADLDLQITKAAMAELAKMSPVFSR